MLLPNQLSPVTIYEMSSWARGSTVPLLIVFDQQAGVAVGSPAITLDELYVEKGVQSGTFGFADASKWRLDRWLCRDAGSVCLSWRRRLDLVPLRKEGLKAAEQMGAGAAGGDGGLGRDHSGDAEFAAGAALRWAMMRQRPDGGAGGWQAVDRFAVESDEDLLRCSPVCRRLWDTALVMRSLAASGLAADHPALVQGGEWLLSKQILDYGDWAVKNRRGKPGAWAFEFENRFYPDVDDSAVVVMALNAVQLPNEALKQSAIDRTVAWIATMQCQAGGWAAFDLNNNQDWLNLLPYADLKAMIDPNTADVTARVLEMAGQLSGQANFSGQAKSGEIDRALAYLTQEQEPEGCWFGRWGVNYIYGTSGVLSALALIAPQSHRSQIERGAAWLVSCQNSDGGWGETCHSYNDPTLKGQGVSTASQTAWALIGLIAAGQATQTFASAGIQQGVRYLIATQRSDGTWDEADFTGTGFPGYFYLKYHLYQQHFPLTALGQYQAIAPLLDS